MEPASTTSSHITPPYLICSAVMPDLPFSKESSPVFRKSPILNITGEIPFIRRRRAIEFSKDVYILNILGKFDGTFSPNKGNFSRFPSLILRKKGNFPAEPVASLFFTLLLSSRQHWAVGNTPMMIILPPLLTRYVL